MSDRPWYSLPCRTPAERALRQRAKKLAAPAGKSGYYTSATGRQYFYGGPATREVARMASVCDIDLPESLTPMASEGRVYWIGQTGVYPAELSSPEGYQRSLENASRADGPENRPGCAGRSD